MRLQRTAAAGVVLSACLGCGASDSTAPTSAPADGNAVRYEPSSICGAPDEQVAFEIVNDTTERFEVEMLDIVDDTGRVVNIAWLGFGSDTDAGLLPVNGTLPPVVLGSLEAGQSGTAVIRLPSKPGSYTARTPNVGPGGWKPPTLEVQVGDC